LINTHDFAFSGPYISSPTKGSGVLKIFLTLSIVIAFPVVGLVNIGPPPKGLP
jgi:hypothetical protein